MRFVLSNKTIKPSKCPQKALNLPKTVRPIGPVRLSELCLCLQFCLQVRISPKRTCKNERHQKINLSKIDQLDWFGVAAAASTSSQHHRHQITDIYFLRLERHQKINLSTIDQLDWFGVAATTSTSSSTDQRYLIDNFINRSTCHQ